MGGEEGGKVEEEEGGVVEIGGGKATATATG